MSTTSRSTRSTSNPSAQRERMLSTAAGLLGILMFVWGFLKWLKVGDGDNARKYAGYAFQMPTTAIIGLSLAAGLTALFGAVESRPGRGVPTAVPTALAATSLLLAVAVLLGKGSISPDLGDRWVSRSGSSSAWSPRRCRPSSSRPASPAVTTTTAAQTKPHTETDKRRLHNLPGTSEGVDLRTTEGPPSS
jgi:hypothetical protein